MNRPYNIVTDHAELKALIKQWELDIDALVKKYRDANKGNEHAPIINKIGEELEHITEEMMSINI